MPGLRNRPYDSHPDLPGRRAASAGLVMIRRLQVCPHTTFVEAGAELRLPGILQGESTAGNPAGPELRVDTRLRFAFLPDWTPPRRTGTGSQKNIQAP